MGNASVHNFDRNNSGGKWPAGRRRHRLQRDIGVDIAGLGTQSLDWIHGAWVLDQWWVLVDMNDTSTGSCRGMEFLVQLNLLAPELFFFNFSTPCI